MLRALESADCEGFPGFGAFKSRHPEFRASEEAVPGPVSALRWLALSGALLSAMYSYDVAQVTAQRPVQAVEPAGRNHAGGEVGGSMLADSARGGDRLRSSARSAMPLQFQISLAGLGTLARP